MPERGKPACAHFSCYLILRKKVTHKEFEKNTSMIRMWTYRQITNRPVQCIEGNASRLGLDCIYISLVVNGLHCVFLCLALQSRLPSPSL